MACRSFLGQRQEGRSHSPRHLGAAHIPFHIALAAEETTVVGFGVVVVIVAAVAVQQTPPGISAGNPTGSQSDWDSFGPLFVVFVLEVAPALCCSLSCCPLREPFQRKTLCLAFLLPGEIVLSSLVMSR